MATQTVACPQCKTALRTSRPLSAQEMVRCPQCGNHFAGASSLAPSVAAPVGGGAALLLLLVPASILAALLGAGAVVGVYFLVKSKPSPTPVVENNRERELVEKQRQLDDQAKELAEQKRRQDYEKLM